MRTKYAKQGGDFMKTIVVNLLGAAGSGKSTLATRIFASLKMKGYNCEYVPEFAKQIVYEENFKKLNNQLYIFANQYYNLDSIRDKVKIIVTDSPILLSIFYNSKGNFNQIPNKTFNDIVLYCYSTFDNLNFFIKRDHEYKQEGRYQNEEQAKKEEKVLQNLLANLPIDLQTLSSSQDCCEIIVNKIIERINNNDKLKKDGNEIERKFILKSMPKGLKDCKKDFITQFYLHSNEKEYRVRDVNHKKFYVTEKFGSGIERQEFEYEISEEEFQSLLEKASEDVIKKVRFYYPLANKTAEIDFYLGKLKGLRTVEVEFPSLAEAKKFKEPSWFGKDVTKSKKYKNINLQNTSFSDIANEK